uniref:HAT C-terminal dimerisation domain-containing protein n=1 Tax=Phytophthora fragariae TaxID=53985 RepID=A0A6A3DQS5_9STRA|nr:hypothetical protein PF009_g28272 [Phytophthora fragariae]
MDDWHLMAEMEAIVGSIADLARIEVQRHDLVLSELIVLLKFAADRLYSNVFQVYNLDAPRTTTTTVASFPRCAVAADELSPLAHTCLARLKGQVNMRIPLATAQTVMILQLDPRTKFSVASLIQHPGEAGEKSGVATDGKQATKERGGDADDERLEQTIAAGNKLLYDAHREVYCKLNAGSCGGDEEAADVSSPNFDLVPSVDDDKVICGAPIAVTKPTTTSKTIQHAQADKVVDEWLEYTVDWVSVACRYSADENKSKDDFTPLMLVRRNGVVCWRVEAVCEHVDILRWFRESASGRFRSIAALARIWLGRAPSNASQERVFSTGGFVMNSLRTRTNNLRAEMQVLLKHNKKEIRHMELESNSG